MDLWVALTKPHLGAFHLEELHLREERNVKISGPTQ